MARLSVDRLSMCPFVRLCVRVCAFVGLRAFVSIVSANVVRFVVFACLCFNFGFFVFVFVCLCVRLFRFCLRVCVCLLVFLCFVWSCCSFVRPSARPFVVRALFVLYVLVAVYACVVRVVLFGLCVCLVCLL